MRDNHPDRVAAAAQTKPPTVVSHWADEAQWIPAIAPPRDPGDDAAVWRLLRHYATDPDDLAELAAALGLVAERGPS